MKYSKLQIAEIHLDEAIRQFLDHQNNVCALHLAGAAEEIIGAAVKKAGIKTALGFLYEQAPVGFPAMSEREFVNFLNEARNSVKHDNRVHEVEIEILNIHAVFMIGRAVGMHPRIFDKPSAEIKRFKKWFAEHGEDYRDNFPDPWGASKN